jgi:hypothetical protein
MRKLILTLAAAGTALAVAAPAAAQYYPQQPYGYGAQQQYGYGQQYGYNNGYGQVRGLQARIDAVQYRIQRLGWRGGSNGLRKEARNIERQLQRSARYGLNPYQANDLSNRIARLEQRVNYAMSSYGRYGSGYGNGYGYNSGYGANNGYGYSDRDGDHRDDRYEDDQGNRRDD